MPIPDFQAIMLPLLKIVEDGSEKSFRNVVETLSTYFNLTEQERKELLPSGQQEIFDNRVGWARTHLKKAGLVESPRRGIIKITQRGKEILGENPESINLKFLKQFPEFVEFVTTKKESAVNGVIEEEQTSETPEELLEKAYIRIRKTLAEDLLSKILNLHPTSFEKLVVELLVKMGYGGSISDAGKAIGKSGDEGIDGTIKEDKLGLDVVYIQAKKWQSQSIIGRPEIQKFVGALAGQGAKKGIFITTSSFTKEALNYVDKIDPKIVLIDGEQLTQLMIDYDLGVSNISQFSVKRIDNDYFGEE